MDLVWGVDEVGRSAIAGPLVICFYVPEKEIEGVTDSKKLKPEQREELYPQLVEAAIDFRVGIIMPRTIDTIGIVRAEMEYIAAMAAHILRLYPNSKIIVDGPRYKSFNEAWEAFAQGSPWENNIEFCIRADESVYAVSAASIVAKVTRDRLMKELAQAYPVYGWETNVGYPTLQHRRAIEEHGLTPLHRLSFLIKED